jgi:hypothetical protein
MCPDERVALFVFLDSEVRRREVRFRVAVEARRVSAEELPAVYVLVTALAVVLLPVIRGTCRIRVTRVELRACLVTTCALDDVVWFVEGETCQGMDLGSDRVVCQLPGRRILGVAFLARLLPVDAVRRLVAFGTLGSSNIVERDGGVLAPVCSLLEVAAVARRLGVSILEWEVLRVIEMGRGAELFLVVTLGAGSKHCIAVGLAVTAHTFLIHSEIRVLSNDFRR